MDWTELRGADPLIAIPERHAEALTRAASRRLAGGHADEAALLLRRRMTLADPPAAAERALLALAEALAGSAEASAAALDAALRADPLDPSVGLVALRLARSRGDAETAARRILASPVSGDEALRRAHAVLLAGDPAAVLRLDLLDGRISGWASWSGETGATLVLEGPDRRTSHPMTGEPGLGFLPPGAHGAFVSLAVPHAVAAVRVERDGTVLVRETLAPRFERGSPGPLPVCAAPVAVPERRPVRIVMPVFADPETTGEALAAALREVARHGRARLVAVDDASPDPRIAELLDALAARGLLELRRNPANLGFTGAVRRGLDEGADEDILILNSDAVLPPGALRRLADAVYAAADIGSATPLSNNGEWTSWPRLGEAAPSPSPERAARLDEAARATGDAPVDLPNGIGFALFVRHDCLAAAGALPAVYERGYFEDLEWSLRARCAGFRNVAAADVFVVHHGSRSFAASRQLLVARNLRRFRRRFPELRVQSAAFRSRDPLQATRARLEAACPPEGAPLLLVHPAGSALARERLHRHRAANREVVTLEWRRAGAMLRAELRGAPGREPRSLGFDAVEEADGLTRWLEALSPSLVELAGAPPPEPLADAILAVDAAFVILAGDLAGAPQGSRSLLNGFEAWRRRLGERWLQVIASDGSTLRALQRHLAGGPDAGRIEAAPAPEPGAPGEPSPVSETLGVLMGVPSPAALRWTLDLAAALRRRRPDARLAVLGSSFDDRALLARNVWASGALEPDAFATAARAVGAGALALPPTDPALALFERVLAQTALPGARAGWCGQGERSDPTSLVFERSRGERHAILAVVDWFAGRLAP